MSYPKAPKVSVCITVFNHAAFLPRVLDYILQQQTDFDFEIIVGDDASSDGSREILLDYKTRYPHKLVLLLNEKNVGVFENGINILKKAKGKYVAMGDGDDFWIYPHKLQQQADFLDAHDDYAGCFHDAAIHRPDSETDAGTVSYFFERRFYSQFNRYNPDFFPWDLVERNIIATSALMFRNNELYNELRGFEDVKLSLSWLYQLLIIRQSKFKYFNAPWTQYNNHGKGITKVKPTRQFTLTNICVLQALLKDNYYNKIPHHLYRSLMTEYENLFYDTSVQVSSPQRISTLWQYFFAAQRYVFYRMINMRRQV
jgi:glycosyltransferase involved in cell wall biosynthesis